MIITYECVSDLLGRNVSEFGEATVLVPFEIKSGNLLPATFDWDQVFL